MTTLKEFLNEYAKTHQNPTNSAIHMICVPVIVTATIGLGWGLSNWLFSGFLSWDLLPFVNIGTVGMFLMLAYYFRLSKKLFVNMVAYAAFTWFVLYGIHHSGYSVFWVSAIFWVAAWAVQFYGHHVEGAKPSFTQDVVFLLIGPAFVLDKVYKRFGSSIVST